MILFGEAVAIVRENSWIGEPIEKGLLDAFNLFTAEQVHAEYDAPPFTNSAMDGYAVGTLTGPWTVVGCVAAGGVPKPIKPDEAIRIFTGAMIPEGSVAVIAQEDCSAIGGSLTTKLTLKHNLNIRIQGEEFRAGDILHKQKTRITPPLMSSLASQGMSKVLTISKPRLAILVTGSELLDPGEEYREGMIYESNSFALRELLMPHCECVTITRIIDNEEATTNQLEQLLASHDVVLTVGGVSVGDLDFVRSSISELGFKTLFAGVAIKPGKPVAFGTRQDGKVWFGLPGNPMSAMITCCLFVLEYLGEGLNFEPIDLTERASTREEFIPTIKNSAGITLNPTVGSHATSGLAQATGLVRLSQTSASYAELPWSVR